MSMSLPVPGTLPTNDIPASYLSLTDVELKTNAILDEIVRDYETNALALYAYVLNQVGYRTLGAQFYSAPSTKGALGCYLEREGNDTDLCSLTIYLLRRCGIPCAYGFLPAPAIKPSDWMQVLGYEPWEPDDDYYYYFYGSTNTIVYAYVSTNGVSTNWVALVPWWKRRSFIEGSEFREIFTNSCGDGLGLADDYLHGRAALDPYVTNTTDLLVDFLPELLKSVLASNSPNTSIDQVGVCWRLVEQAFTNWPTDYDIVLDPGDTVTASPSLADNRRDTVSMKLVKGGGGVMFSNTFYTCELHNRRVLVSFEPATAADWAKVANGFYEAGTTFDMVGTLSLGPSPQSGGIVITGSVAQKVKMGDPVALYASDGQRTFSAGSYECYVFDFGQVTHQMLDQHYAVLSDLSVLTKTTTNLVWSNVDARELLGEQLCTVGFNYYLLMDKSMRWCEERTKTRSCGLRAVGSFYFNLATQGGSTFLADSMSIDAFSTLLLGFKYLHDQDGETNLPYRCSEPFAQERDWFTLAALSASTLEHGILQKTVGFDDAMSSDKCLRMAVEGGGYVTNLTASTYNTPPNQQIISNVDAGAYATLQAFFTSSPEGQVWFPSRRITNASYAGYGWVELDVNTNDTYWSAAYKITGGNFGGRSQVYTEPAYESTSWSQTQNNSVPVSATTPPETLLTPFRQQDTVQIDYAGAYSTRTVDFIAGSGSSAGGQYALDATVGQAVWGAAAERTISWSPAAQFYGLGSESAGDTFSSEDLDVQTEIADSGPVGNSAYGEFHRGILDTLADPVDTRTGEFYVDDLDLMIPGPKPIAFRRAYSSAYGAIGEFGFGWRFNHSCYLAVNTNATEIRAVEPDGTVLRYTNSGANVWSVSVDLNPRLGNANERGIGSTANPFANRIEKTTQAGSTNYIVTTADGERRTYTVKSYNDGVLARNRPYLTQWTDANSNSLTYAYGTDSNRVDFGRITEIRNAHHFVKMKYNSAGRLREVLCDDGRLLTYEYSAAGDLAGVCRPDGSAVRYDYAVREIPRRKTVALDGCDDYLEVVGGGDLTVTTGLTIEVWIKVDGNPPTNNVVANWLRLVGAGGGGVTSYGLWRWNKGDIMFQIKSPSGTNSLMDYGNPELRIGVNQGWHHVAGTWDGSVARLYIDGDEKLSSSYSATPFTNDEFTIGHAPGTTNFNGQMDDILVWGCARNADQVMQDMSYGVTNAAPGLIGGWTFNADDGSDSSANGNTCSFLGGARIKTDNSTYSTHLITRESKPGGRILENTYDDQRRVVEQKATVGLSATPVRNATFTYLGDGNNGITIASNIFGAATTLAYSNGLIVGVTDALGFSESNEWDAARNLLCRTDKRGVTTRFAYDGKGNATNILLIGDVSGNGVVTTSITWMTYTTNSLLASRTTPRGDVTRFYYDARRNLVTQELCRADADPWNPTNNVVYRRDAFQYNAQGKLTNKTVAAGSADAVTAAYVYDQDGNLTQSTLDAGHGQQVIAYNYTVNARGWVTRRTDPTGAYTTFDYDAMGRAVTRSDYSAGGTLLDRRTFVYDENGNILTEDGPRTSVDDSVTRTWDRQDRLLTRTTKRYDVGLSGSYPTYAPAGDATGSSVYDGFGNLIQTTDPNGNVARHVYDAEGQRTHTTNYQGSGSTVLAAVQQWYDTGGLVVSNKTPRGYIVQTTYNAQGKPTSKTHADGAVEQWRYDSAGQVTQYINPRSIRTRYRYDDFGRLTNRVEAVGTGQERSFAFTYDLRGNLIATRNPEGFVSSSIFDGADRVVAEIGASGASPQTIWSNCYDGTGRLVQRIGADSYVSNSYDGLGRILLKGFFRNGYCTPDYYELYQYSVDDYNDTRTVIYGGQEYVDNFLDAVGRVGATVYHDYTRKLFRYDANGNLIQQIDEIDRTTSYTYDGLDRAVTVTTPDGVTITNRYDPDGNPTNTLYPYGVTYLREYDPRGRMTTERVTRSGQGTLFDYAYQYDANGNVVTQSTARGVTVASTFDALDRRTALSAAAPTPLMPSVSQSFSYTANGWLETATEGDRSLRHLFDQYGRVLSETNSMGDTTLSSGQTFDAQGRRITCHIGPADESWSYQWNGAERVTNVSWSGVDFRIGYDALTRTKAVLGPFLSMTNTWAIRHRIEARTFQHLTNTVRPYTEYATYRDDNSRWDHGVQYAGEGVFYERWYDYDSLNQLTYETVYDGTNWITKTYAYDSVGSRTNMVHDGPISWTRSAQLDEFRRVVTESTTTTGSNPVITVSGYVLYCTNVLLKLNGTNVGNAVVDTNSHLWSLSGVALSGGSNLVEAVADPDRPWATNAVSTVTLNLYVRGSYVYDADGNLVYCNRGNKDYSYVWDALGRLAAATVRDGAGSGLNWQAEYDALSRRVQTITTPVTNNSPIIESQISNLSLHDPLYSMQEVYRSEGTNTAVYLFGPDLSDTVGGLGGIGGLLALKENGQLKQAMSDMRGNVVGVVDGSGAAAFNPRFSAFGPLSPPALNAPSFSTRRYDPTGLYDFGARPYDPVTGRMLAPDPARFLDSRNLMAFVANDPINQSDPDGRLSTSQRNTFSFRGDFNVGGSSFTANQDFSGRGLNTAVEVQALTGELGGEIVEWADPANGYWRIQYSAPPIFGGVAGPAVSITIGESGTYPGAGVSAGLNPPWGSLTVNRGLNQQPTEGPSVGVEVSPILAYERGLVWPQTSRTMSQPYGTSEPYQEVGVGTPVLSATWLYHFGPHEQESP